MAAGYRSNAARWLGGASAPPYVAPAIKAGYRSILAFWLGGAAANPAIPPIVELPGGAGWGRVGLKHVEILLREELLRAGFSETEEAAILAAIAWTLK